MKTVYPACAKSTPSWIVRKSAPPLSSTVTVVLSSTVRSPVVFVRVPETVVAVTVTEQTPTAFRRSCTELPWAVPW